MSRGSGISFEHIGADTCCGHVHVIDMHIHEHYH